MDTNIRKQLTSHVTTAEEATLASDTPVRASRQRWLKMATGDVDRAGDVLVLGGIETANFLKNPQFLWQHGLSGETVNTIGIIRRLLVRNNALYALADYAEESVSPLA